MSEIETMPLNSKFQNPNVKSMSKLKVEKFWYLGFGFDLKFDL